MADLCEELTEGRPDTPVAAAFGVFDGVHLGHQRLLRTLTDSATKRGLTPIVITLANHPLSVLKPEMQLVLITSLKERCDLLTSHGAQRVVPITFTQEVSRYSAEEFTQILCDCIGLKHLVVGPDFAMGHDREGTIPVLTSIGERLGFTVEVAPHLVLNGMSVRSSAVRKALADGNLATVERFLGRRFSLDGPVVEGEGRGGGLLGFPTVNIGLGPLQALPADGIYATWIEVNGERHPAATSIGIKPTFHDQAPRVVESFILDFDANLYGEHVRVEFVELLRGQEKFDSVDALIEQMKRDVDQTRSILAR